jgi:hypothetical protein
LTEGCCLLFSEEEEFVQAINTNNNEAILADMIKK